MQTLRFHSLKGWRFWSQPEVSNQKRTTKVTSSPWRLILNKYLIINHRLWYIYIIVNLLVPNILNLVKRGEVWNAWAWLVVNTSWLRGVYWRRIRGVQRWEMPGKRVGRLPQGGKSWKQYHIDDAEIWMMRPLKEYGGSKQSWFSCFCFTVFRTLLLQLLIQLLLVLSWKTKRTEETCFLCAEGCIWQHPVNIASFMPTIPKWIVYCVRVRVSQSQPVMGSCCSQTGSRFDQLFRHKKRTGAFMGVSQMIAVILKHAFSLNGYVDIFELCVAVAIVQKRWTLRPQGVNNIQTDICFNGFGSFLWIQDVPGGPWVRCLRLTEHLKRLWDHFGIPDFHRRVVKTKLQGEGSQGKH